MKAPTEKSNDICQIVVTRACDLYNCSNCTQLLPFRQDALHMGLDCFRDACRSLRGWPGVVALFGGNPCSHPKFDELCYILAQEVPEQHRRGLWTNNFLGHGQIIRDTFYPHGRFNLNAHCQSEAAAEMERWCPGRVIPESRDQVAWHTAVLVDRQDLKVSEEEWVALRENCDINQNWSSAILERDGRPYAYFCEVAGALDGVRGENNGIPATDGWWEEPMGRFLHQVEACCDRGCGVPLKLKGHPDRDDTYDLTRTWQKVEFRGRIKRQFHRALENKPRATVGTDYFRRWSSDD